ncbi:MAG: cob(I)yrinic acid a,c-diamide adenosyltransferase [Clostridia bacterium]|nr:cob(I)yrinic acid a,c-diamide adenosyltransferase [Clostridia bacterium]
MKIYTKAGDAGTTSLVHTKNIAKSDDRVEVMGTIDELTSHIGLVKGKISSQQTVGFLETIQKTLMTIMAGIADSYNTQYKLKEASINEIEKEIDKMEASFERPKHFILPGTNPLSAQIDVARCVARRAERCLSAVSIKFGSDTGAKKYLNRLADYLYILARYYDAASDQKEEENLEKESKLNQDELVQEVLLRMGYGKITLDMAKKLIEKIEEEAKRRGKNAVIAICGPDGNPVAVHVMDGAYLVSFDVAVRKAYTAVAVKMSTMELSKLAQPGGNFYGLDKLEGGKIVIFGGGVPLVKNDNIIGGLGISGGTGEEDHSLCEYALSLLS